jgi:uncharacterized membrane protein
MKFRQFALALTAAALALWPAGPAAAQKAGPQGGGASVVTVQVCNNTDTNARVALSYQPVGSNAFYNQGWYGVAAHSCQSLVDTDNGYIYAYAEVENDGTQYWNGDNGQCVMYPGPYAFWSNASTTCDSGQEVRNFVTLHTNDWGVFTWNLNP